MQINIKRYTYQSIHFRLGVSGTFVLMMELSFSRPFVPWNIRSQQRIILGTFVLWSFRHFKISYFYAIKEKICCPKWPIIWDSSVVVESSEFESKSESSWSESESIWSETKSKSSWLISDLGIYVARESKNANFEKCNHKNVSTLKKLSQN